MSINVLCVIAVLTANNLLIFCMIISIFADDHHTPASTVKIMGAIKITPDNVAPGNAAKV